MEIAVVAPFVSAAALVVGIASLCLMIILHRLTTRFEKSVANRNKQTLEFMANLIVNAAYDPNTVRRLVLDYPKGMEWRGVVSYRGKKQHSIAWEVPSPEEITIGDLKIAIARQRPKRKNASR